MSVWFTGPQDDTFTLESTDSGAGRTIKLEQTEGNLLNALFGSGADGALKTGSSASSSTLTLDTVKGSPVLTSEDDFKEVKQGTFKLMVNGKEYTLSLPKKDDDSRLYQGRDHHRAQQAAGREVRRRQYCSQRRRAP